MLTPRDWRPASSGRPRRRLPRSTRRRSLGPVAAALLLGIVGTLAVTAVAGARATTQQSDGQAPTAPAVRLVSPAVVRIMIVETSQVVCTGCASDGTNITLPANGGTYYQAYSGSGVLVSPDGTIVTADHVIDGTADDANDFLADAAQDWAQMANVSVADAQSTLQTLQQQGRLQIAPQVVTRRVFFSTAYLGLLPTGAHAAHPTLSFDGVQVIARSPMSEHDIAIVKIAGQNLPYASLASAGATHVQDAVTAIAFPGEADVGAGLYDSPDYSGLFNPAQATATQLDDLLTPTVEDGQIIGEKWLADGTPIFETTSIGNHGSSGGPVVDTQGRVVGFVDRLATTVNSSGMLVVIPSSVIAPYLKQAGIPATGKRAQGSLMTEWMSALAAFEGDGACHWTAARDALSRLQARFPQFGGVQAYLAQARTQAATARCFSISALVGGLVSGYPGGLGSLINYLLFGALIGLVLTRQPRLQAAIRTRRQPRALAVASARAWARQVPLWSLALQCLGAGALAGVIAPALTAAMHAPPPGRLAFPGDLVSGLTAGLVLCLLIRLFEPRSAEEPTPPAATAMAGAEQPYPRDGLPPTS